MSLEPRLPPHASEAIGLFLAAHGTAPGVDGFVVGLSGGIDSALTLRLARDAVGPGKVLGLLMPDASYPAALAEETRAYARSLGVEHRELPIDRIEGAYAELLPELRDRVARGNAKARIRMTLAYAVARERHRLVLGTSNKSELLLGYFTKWGDGGADLEPLGDLYKTALRSLAEAVGVPEAIRRRPPTAGLWEGQTDEGELGLPYERLDRILYGLEQLLTVPEISQRTGEPEAAVAAIAVRVDAARHKRRMPPIPKLGLRTVGIDWKD